MAPEKSDLESSNEENCGEQQSAVPLNSQEMEAPLAQLEQQKALEFRRLEDIGRRLHDLTNKISPLIMSLSLIDLEFSLCENPGFVESTFEDFKFKSSPREVLDLLSTDLNKLLSAGSHIVSLVRSGASSINLDFFNILVTSFKKQFDDYFEKLKIIVNLTFKDLNGAKELLDETSAAMHEYFTEYQKFCNFVDEGNEIPDVSKVEVKSLIEGVTQKMCSSFPEVKVELSLDDNCIVYLDGSKLGRVLENLIKNAMEAMGYSGTLILDLEKKGCKVMIGVADNGIGIPSENLYKIFDLYFTYGKKGGSGFGLNNAKLIIERFGGTIKVESTKGEGTTFKISLPAFEPVVTGVEPTAVVESDGGEVNSAVVKALVLDVFNRLDERDVEGEILDDGDVLGAS